MGTETPNDIDRVAIAEHAQRMAEQSALRRVRKALDGMAETEGAKRQTLRYVLIACAVLAVLAIWLSWELVFGVRDVPKPALKVPDTLQRKP